MKLKMLVVIGAIAPVLLAVQPAAAVDGKSRVILAQSQSNTAKDSDADKSGAKDKKRKAGDAKDKKNDGQNAQRDHKQPGGNKSNDKDNDKRKGNDDRKSAQQQPVKKTPSAVKDNDDSKRDQRKSATDKDEKNAQRDQKPSQKRQVGGNKDNDKDNDKSKDDRKSTQQQPVKKTPSAVKDDDDSRRDQRKSVTDKDEKKKDDKAERKQDRGKDDERRGQTTFKRADDDRKDAARHKRLDDLRRERKETHEGNRIVIREQNRIIVRQDGHAFIRHDDSDRFRRGARSVHEEHRNGHRVTVVVRPDGTRIITEWSRDGRILRRIRRGPSGREYVLYHNRDRGPRHDLDFIVRLGPLALHIPRERYIVDAGRADRGLLYDTLIAGPLEPIAQPYTLDEVRYSYDLRERMRRIDLDSINFETGSWDVGPMEARQLEPIAEAMRRAIERNPDEVFLIEGHTDAVGSWEDNLSLSDRRAEAVAEILTAEFGIPPENLVTQGYGEQHLKVPTQGPERANRRVTIRRITPLLHS